jgi:hypothetical protein
MTYLSGLLSSAERKNAWQLAATTFDRVDKPHS